jgi:hypothetical protein
MIANNAYSAQITIRNFLRVHESASLHEKRELENLWTQAGLGPFPPQENS